MPKHLFLIQHYKDDQYRRCIYSCKRTCTLEQLDSHVKSTEPAGAVRSSWDVLAMNVKEA